MSSAPTGPADGVPTAGTTVGFCGLGLMGSRIARNVAAGGARLTVWNRTRSAADDFAAGTGGCRVADRPAAAAEEADLVLTMLADDPAVEEVYFGEGGLLDGLRPGSVAVDMSTVAPRTSRRVGAELAAHGVGFVDAPVSGSTATAESRALTLMLGGSDADVARARPVLETVGRALHHLGPVGAGATMKLSVNSIVYGLMEAVSEALVLAERTGIDRAAAYAVFADSAIAAPVVLYRRALFERPGEGPVSFRLALGVKDLRLITDLARSVGAPVPQAETTLQTLASAAADGFADWDLAGVAEWLRRSAGREDT